MDAVTKELLMSLAESRSAMVEQLHQFCVINSGTENIQGLQIMQQTLTTAFKPVADQLTSIPMPPVNTVNMDGEFSTQAIGDALIIRKRPELKRRILLTGHMDTVYPATSLFQSLKYIDDNQINGPGVADMKGGLIVMLHALNAFEQTDVATSLGWDVIINADEEIGSPASSLLFDEVAGNYQAALIYEPAMDIFGTLAKNRKGSGKLTIVAKGRAAHAGRDFYEGRNAICYLAEAIVAINQLNGQREGVTINVGKVAGGTALNIVPDTAVVKLDIRISLPEDEHWMREQLQRIFNDFQRPDYSLAVHGSFGRPVKRICQKTAHLFHRIQSAGEKLGLIINWKDSGGCCDGNNLAHNGVPVIDTLGVRGGSIHCSDEFILLDSLPERAALTTLLLIDLANNGLEELAK